MKKHKVCSHSTWRLGGGCGVPGTVRIMDEDEPEAAQNIGACPCLASCDCRKVLDRRLEPSCAVLVVRPESLSVR